MATRTVTVEVPDDDAAQANIEKLAADMRAGFDPIILRRPPGFTDEDMMGLFGQLLTVVKAAQVVVEHREAART